MTRFGEPAGVGFRYDYEGELLHEEDSPFQRIAVWAHEAFGRVLTLDGLVQTTTRDEFIYHEMLAHVPLLAHPAPASVLVVGGGDGGTLRHVLMHPTVRRAVLVEIDERVIEVSRRLLPGVSAGALDDPRAEVVVADGAAYVHEDGERFDAVLVDSSDPIGPGEVLFTRAFYAAAARRLAPGGLLACQSGGPFFQQRELHRAFTEASAAFAEVRPYLAAVPTYPGTLWSFLLAGERVRIGAAAAGARAEERGIRARWWTPEVHGACFALPRLVREVIAPAGPPLTWGPSPEDLGG